MLRSLVLLNELDPLVELFAHLVEHFTRLSSFNNLQYVFLRFEVILRLDFRLVKLCRYLVM